MNIEFPIEDIDVINIIFDNEAVIYGGYIRDLVAQVEPTDIDVVLSELYQDSFFHDMEVSGYTRYFDDEKGVFVFNKDDNKTVEVVTVDHDPDDVLLGGVTEPDFDVNLLTANGSSLYSWIDPNQDIDPIMEHIRDRIAVQLSDDVGYDRIEKMIRKGYTIQDSSEQN